MTILSDVKALGQQIWLDNLSRSLVQSGELAQMLKQGVCGVTSNPAIFQKPSLTTRFMPTRSPPSSGKPQPQTTLRNHGGCRRTGSLRRLPCRTRIHRRQTGFVSLEVSPELAKDAQGTVEEARRLHAAIARKTP